MSLLIDPREGSYLLALHEPIRSMLSICPKCKGLSSPSKAFTRHHSATPCKPCHSTGRRLSSLDSADIAFSANGPDGDIMVGIELKSISDLASSLISKRLQGIGGQIPRMLEEYHVSFLLIYGRYRPGPNGELQVFKPSTPKRKAGFYSLTLGSRTISYSYITAFLSGVSLYYTGVHSHRVESLQEAAIWISILYSNWTEPYSKHKSLRCINDSSQPEESKLRSVGMENQDRNPRWKQKVKTFSTLPGVGFERAVAMADKFPSVRAGINASIQQLETVEVKSQSGRIAKLGPVIAESIIEAVK